MASIYDDYLMHYGVKGMKWGVRKDRYEKAFKPGKKGTGSPAERATQASGNIVETTKRLVSRKKRRPKQDYSQLSDRELQTRIRRLQLERSYSSLTDPGISRGKQKALDILDVSGDVMALAASGAIIGTQIYRIKHG